MSSISAGAFLERGSGRLKRAGIGTARLDILVMLEDCLRASRAHILAHPELELQGPALQKLEKWLTRRARHEPLAYIRGFSEFYGRRFKLNKNVLQPRPESETMIDLLKRIVNDGPRVNGGRLLIADIGTGSGALGITAQLEIPTSQVIATDIDKKCLEVAKKNAKKHRADIQLLHGDLFYPLSPIPYPLFAILANLPYVPSYHYINEAAGQEPRHSIFGGGDGLELYRRLFSQLADHRTRPSFVFTEAMPPQHSRLSDIAAGAGFNLHATQDFIQIFKQI